MCCYNVTTSRAVTRIVVVTGNMKSGIDVSIIQRYIYVTQPEIGDIDMAIYDNTDVRTIWFKNLNGEKCTITPTPWSISRKQVGDLLDMICSARRHGTAEAGYTVVGGGFVNWSVKDGYAEM